MKQWSILIIDDDPIQRRILARSFDRERFIVATAGSAAEALDSLSVNKFDLAISDINMPESSGIALLKLVRGLGILTPFCFISADQIVPDGEHAKIGAVSFLKKPFSPATLVGNVLAYLTTLTVN